MRSLPSCMMSRERVHEAARFPSLHAGILTDVLMKLADCPRRIADLGDELSHPSTMWHEKNRQDDGTITRNADRSAMFAKSTEEWVLSGPHFFVANPFNKTPRSICALMVITMSSTSKLLSDSYLPRTNYLPMADRSEYERRIPV